MKKYSFLALIPFVWLSCTEDVSREINTDLTQEADQFFRFSEALSESSYLGNLSYLDFFRIDASELPGCPSIVRNLGTQKIELDYSNSQECQQLNDSLRSGKIIIDFSDPEDAVPTWTVNYENYFFNETEISGLRKFSNTSFNENQESFENLKIVLADNLGFVTSGTFSYSVAEISFRPFALSTRGRIEGTNPAGRDFSLVITEAKEQLFSCYREGWVLPQTGKETWIISRNASSRLDYMISFESSDVCDPTVISTLPDGRTLQLNP